MAFLIVFAAASLVLLARVAFGPFTWVHSPLNAESVAALALVSGLLYRAGKATPHARERISPVVLAGLAAAVIAAFWPGVTAPLIHDGYFHVGRLSGESFGSVIRSAFVHPAPGDDPFFRPLAYLSYWIDYRWAGFDATSWHLWNLAVHLINCALVWVFARRLSLSPFACTVAALVFALHGTRPEVVSWAGARFDLLATLFTLAAVIAAERVASLWIVGLLTALAVLSKESAFCLPLLIAILILFRPERKRRLWQSAAVSAAVCVVFFAYRTWFLGGIGGYTTVAGEPSIFQFSAIRTAKALFFRQWAILFFPVNWSAEPEPILIAASALMLSAAGAFLLFSRGSRRQLGACVAFVIAAVLPAQHLLLIGADLSGARVLYLPVAGLALLWAFAVDGIEAKHWRVALPLALLLFQLAGLEHNLRIWRSVAFEARSTCRGFGSEIANDPRPVVVRDLPSLRNGVFFLSKGFPQCVAMNSGVPADRIHISDSPPDARAFTWSGNALNPTARH